MTEYDKQLVLVFIHTFQNKLKITGDEILMVLNNIVMILISDAHRLHQGFLSHSGHISFISLISE